MHRFWEIDEMVCLLVTILKIRHRALASAIALACCSKRLADTVLEPLWEEIRGLHWLMRCLPPNTWEMRDREFVFLRRPSNKEWVRFSSYARRIRTFYLRSPLLRGPGVSLAAFNLLSMQTPTPGQYLLPNLRSIYWEIDSWDLAPFLRLFVDPGLTNVYIKFPDKNQHLYRPTTISLIPTRDLTHLQLVSMEDEDSSPDTLQNLLDEASETLRSVSLDGQLSMAIIEKLLQLPNLRSLDVQLPGTRIYPSKIMSSSLEKLVVSYQEAGSGLHILRSIASSQILELDVTFTGSSSTYLQTLGSSLLQTGVGRTLISLTCTSRNTIPLTEAGVRPLLPFGRLMVLELAASCTLGHCGVKLDDSIVSELAMALPQLTHLGLGDTPCDASTSDVTVASLAALSTNCVDLDFLRLHFNTRDITARGAHSNPETHKFACKLRALSVGSQPLPHNNEDILLVTFTILHIFPHVEKILSATGGWKQVKRSIELFRKAPGIIFLLT